MSAANSPVNKVVLYQTWGSSCAFRVRICLHLKGISYDKILVNQSTPVDENREKSHALNPMKFVPVLQVDGHSLIESLAIMEYLEELKPEPSLLPKDLFKRANVRAICNIIVSGIQPLQNTGVLNLITEYTDDDKRKTWAKHWITKGFDALEQMLVNNSGAYCVGDEITFADCCLVPQVINARRLHVNLEPYPLITQIDSNLKSHPAFREAHPTMQEGFPDSMRDDPAFLL